MRLRSLGERAGLLFLVIAAALLLLWKPDQVPPLWFDEGWNLSVAANLVKIGAYAQLSLGQPVAPSLVSTGWPGILPLAASFQLFGVGAWQGRLPGILFTTAGLVLLYGLARRLYNGRVAVATLFVSLLMTGAHIHLHPVVLGRQALGEMPAVCYLLAGYLCLVWAGGGGHGWHSSAFSSGAWRSRPSRRRFPFLHFRCWRRLWPWQCEDSGAGPQRWPARWF